MLADTEYEDKKEFLIKHLNVINQGLPSNIYIPFVNNSWRNYAILNICENESKLFFTKKRAPYLLCLEIYRPEEILLTAQNKYRQLPIAPPLQVSDGIPRSDGSIDGMGSSRIIDNGIDRT